MLVMAERRGPDRFTITFYNKYDLEEDEVRVMFSEIGRIIGFSYKNSRFFIRYGSKDEAQEALDKYRDKLQADFARERATGGGGSGGGGGRTDHSDRNDSSNEGGRFRRMESNDDSRPGRSDDDSAYNRKAIVPVAKIPELIDSTTKAPEKFLFIIGNLPPKFTQDDVHNLIAEINPVHVGKIDTTPDDNLSFCPIHLDTMEKVKYLYEKLDFFVVGGHKLIAMEASQLLEEAGLGAA